MKRKRHNVLTFNLLTIMLLSIMFWWDPGGGGGGGVGSKSFHIVLFGILFPHNFVSIDLMSLRVVYQTEHFFSGFMLLPTVVNFINILLAHFSYESAS